MTVFHLSFIPPQALKGCLALNRGPFYFSAKPETLNSKPYALSPKILKKKPCGFDGLFSLRAKAVEGGFGVKASGFRA